MQLQTLYAASPTFSNSANLWWTNGIPEYAKKITVFAVVVWTYVAPLTFDQPTFLPVVGLYPAGFRSVLPSNGIMFELVLVLLNACPARESQGTSPVFCATSCSCFSYFVPVQRDLYLVIIWCECILLWTVTFVNRKWIVLWIILSRENSCAV